MRTSSLAIALFSAVALVVGCSHQTADTGVTASADRASRGAAVISRYGCGSCHVISGIRGARGLVGPPLKGIRDRIYVGGMLQNNPENLRLWIRDPKALNPKTAMPTLGLTEQDVSDIAAYLYSID